jgi:hypothetical protein
MFINITQYLFYFAIDVFRLTVSIRVIGERRAKSNAQKWRSGFLKMTCEDRITI